MILENMVTPVGKLFKPHGFKGEITVDFDYDSEIFDPEASTFFINIDNILVPFFSENIRNGSRNNFLLKLKDINSDKDALSLSNKTLYFSKAELASFLSIGESELEDLVEGYTGYEILDNDTGNILGIAENIEEGVEYDYIIIKRLNNKNTIEIPFIEEFITKIEQKTEKQRGRIYVTLPDGFLEL